MALFVQSPSLAERLDALEGHYHLHFAGRPRATRDPAMLDAMLAALRQAGPSAQGARIAQLQQAWEAERAQIVSAQEKMTPRGVIAARTLERVGRICARLPRLARLAPHGQTTQAELRALDTDLDEAKAHLTAMRWPPDVEPLLRGEMDRQEQNVRRARADVEAWRTDGITQEATLLPAQHAARAVSVVQRLMGQGRAHAEGRPQHVIRPAMLEVWAEGLEEMATQFLRGRPAHVSAEHHEQNRLAILQQAQFWREEAEAARQTRRQRSVAEMASALLDEADVILEAADGIGGATTSLQDAAGIAMRMDEVLRQLEELPTAFGLGNHAQATLGIADCLAHLDGRLAHVAAA